MVRSFLTMALYLKSTCLRMRSNAVLAEPREASAAQLKGHQDRGFENPPLLLCLLHLLSLFYLSGVFILFVCFFVHLEVARTRADRMRQTLFDLLWLSAQS